MRSPRVKTLMLGQLMLVDADGLPVEKRMRAEVLALEGLELIPTPMRCTEQECSGDVPSILLAAYKMSELVGVVSITGLSVVEREGNLLKVKALIMPYFPGAEDELAVAEALFSRLFQQPVELANGKQLAILDFMEFRRLKSLDPNDAKQARVIGLSEKAEAAGFSEILPDPDDPVREVVRVRRAQ